MLEIQAKIKCCLILSLSALLVGCQPKTNSQAFEVAESAAAPSDCRLFRFTARSEMVAPYVAIVIAADSNFTIAKVKSPEELTDVEVERISSTDSVRLREELASATDRQNTRIFIVADGNSRIRSYIASLDALSILGLSDFWIVVDERSN